MRTSILLTGLKGSALGTLALGRGTAVAAANLDRLQRAAVAVGVVVGTAVHTALNAGIARLLIHKKTSSKLDTLLIGFHTMLRALTVWTVFLLLILSPDTFLSDFLPTKLWE